MKVFLLFLVSIFLLLQYQLWLDQNGVRKVVHLNKSVQQKQQANRELYERNEVLAAEVEDLKTGYNAIEERARTELGMIREGETFIQVIEPSAEDSK